MGSVPSTEVRFCLKKPLSKNSHHLETHNFQAKLDDWLLLDPIFTLASNENKNNNNNNNNNK